MTDQDPTEASRAWMDGELSSRDYFNLVRRSNQQPRLGLWRRLLQRLRPR